VDIGGAHHHQTDAHEAGRQWDQEPVADVGDNLTLAPPGPAGIASRPMAQQREHDAEADGNRDDLENGLAGDLQDADEFADHDSLTDAEKRSIRYRRARLRSGVWRARAGLMPKRAAPAGQI